MLERIIEEIYCMKRDKKGDYERPHKPALLLALLMQFESGSLSSDGFSLTKNLEDDFKLIFEVVKQGNDQPKIANPFYRLAGQSFWTVYDDKEQDLHNLIGSSHAPKISTLRSSQVKLSSDFLTLLKAQKSRDELREAIISRYFPKFAQELHKRFSYDDEVGQVLEVAEAKPARDAAFAKVVKQVYDYRCAACGQRILVDKVHFVDAAHLMPFSLSYNDHPSNGMALCKNHHWAMDHKLIAPHPDDYWVVSEKVDDRYIENESLLSLNKRSIIAPKDKKYAPDKEAMDWRVGELI